MTITAAQVKELRERTGAGMMECKKALIEAGEGGIEKAIELMRISGQTKADKKAGRTTAEGAIAIKIADDLKSAAILEVNCETDFVAKDDNFKNFIEIAANLALNAQVSDVQQLLALNADSGKTLEELRQELISKVGENIQVRRLVTVADADVLGQYIHGGRIGVLVQLQGGSAELSKDIAMHIAASNPLVVAADDVSEELIAKEREIFSAQAMESGKPKEIVEKMVAGRIQKYLAEVSLQGQSFVKDPEQTVGDLLRKANAKVVAFTRFEVGEGIEKKVDNFVAEVMAQAKGA